MSNIRSICVITGSRAEYDLLYWLIKGIDVAHDMELQIIATGTHLSDEFGLTYKGIENDGFHINHKVDMLLSSDNDISIGKSMGLGIICFSDALSQLQPDLVIVLGDRFEIFSAVSAATVLRIPIAHIHGGETTEGAYDESFRHSISKMSHIHFTATIEYSNRVVQLGEQPNRVFNVGAVGIDNIKRLKLLSRSQLEKDIDFKFGERNLLITFHPATLERDTYKEQFRNLLLALDELTDVHLIFTMANADTGGKAINSMIEEYVITHQSKAVSYKTLGRLYYLSVMKYMDGVVGNSSSGIVEAPSFRIGTLNIGNRQSGRIKPDSVIDCNPTVDSIRHAVNKLFSSSFKMQLDNVTSPYGDGSASDKILDIVHSFPLNGILKKKFYDL